MQKGIFLQDLDSKSTTVNNAIIQLGDIDDSGKGRKFVSKFIQPGLVKIEGHGIVLLKKETLDESLPTIVGSPVIIQHKDVTEENADELRCGVIANAYFNQPDGWYYVDGIIWDDKAQELINKGWSVSCSYDYLAFNDEGGEENNIHYDKEFTQLNFTHLAIVDNPRYERANIVFNSKDEEKGKWVTVKGNHIFIPDGKTLDEVIKEKGWGDKDEAKGNKSDKKDNKEEPEWLKQERKKLDRQTTQMYEDRYSVEHPETYKKNLEEAKDKQSDSKDRPSTDKRYYTEYSAEEKKFIKESKDKGHTVYRNYPQGELISYDPKTKLYSRMGSDRKMEETAVYKEKLKYVDGPNKTDNSKEQDMAIIEELKKLIFKVENNKENETMVENEKVDKRKLIDEVAGIMKSAGCDDEDIRTAIGKMEKIGYDDSEASADNKKVKNEVDEEEEKKVDNEEDEKEDKKEEDVKNKCKNESEEDKEKVEELKEEEKEDVDNRCKNSKGQEFFDKINKIYNSAKKVDEPSTSYESRQSRLEAGEKYFG